MTASYDGTFRFLAPMAICDRRCSSRCGIFPHGLPTGRPARWQVADGRMALPVLRPDEPHRSGQPARQSASHPARRVVGFVVGIDCRDRRCLDLRPVPAPRTDVHADRDAAAVGAPRGDDPDHRADVRARNWRGDGDGRNRGLLPRAGHDHGRVCGQRRRRRRTSSRPTAGIVGPHCTWSSIPSALPSLFAAARISVPGALIGALIGEWLGSGQGLGSSLIKSIPRYQYNELWASVAIVTIVSILLYAVVGVLRESRPLRVSVLRTQGGRPDNSLPGRLVFDETTAPSVPIHDTSAFHRREFLRYSALAGFAIGGPGSSPPAAVAIRQVRPVAVHPTDPKFGSVAVQLSWIKNIEFAGEYFALDKGYYKEAGFGNVDLVSGGAAGTGVEAGLDTGQDLDRHVRAAAHRTGRTRRSAGEDRRRDLSRRTPSASSAPRPSRSTRRRTWSARRSASRIPISWCSARSWTPTASTPSRSPWCPLNSIPSPLANGEVDGWVSYVTNEPITLAAKGFTNHAILFADFNLPLVGESVHGQAGDHRQRARQAQGVPDRRDQGLAGRHRRSGRIRPPRRGGVRQGPAPRRGRADQGSDRTDRAGGLQRHQGQRPVHDDHDTSSTRTSPH